MPEFPRDRDHLSLTSPRKFRNQPQVIDNLRFASKREAGRYLELKMLQAAGAIRGLIADKRLLRFPLKVNDQHICTYEADFQYSEMFAGAIWEKVTEDAKGFKTPVYRLKKKLMLACHGIEIREV